MKNPNFVYALFIAFLWLYPQGGISQITGRVTDDNMLPLSGAHIQIRDTDLGTQTDLQGEYTLDAYPGDRLLFSHLGMEPVKVRVKKNEYVINVQMASTSIELEEVEIRKKVKTGHMSQMDLLRAYPTDKSLVKTSRGIIDKDRSSTYFRIVDGRDLFPGLSLLEALKVHIPSLRVIGDNAYLRSYGVGEYPALIEVDGFICPAPTHLSPFDIDRVAVMEGNSAYMRYGPQGAGGAIIVNTKAQTWMDDMGVDRSEAYRMILDSVMKVTHYESYSPHTPSYLQKIHKVRVEKRAMAIVEDQQNSYINNPYFFLELYDLFLSRWGYSRKSKELSAYITKKFPDNIPVLKALAYLQQRHGFYLDALSLYTEILKTQSWHAQALRDLANAYAEIGENEKAWWYYTEYINILEQLPNGSFDPYGEDQLIATEMINLLELNNELPLNADTINTGIDDIGPQIRLVFEWNSPEAEFELQFVTPEGYYDTWEHKSKKDAPQNSISVNEYNSHQFFLGKENIGLWQVNIDYKGNHSEAPTYLKVAIYRDYGLRSQNTEIKIFKLSLIHERMQLFTLNQS
jgi:hypothetical protein